MSQDPLFSAILEAISKPLDTDKFEECSAELVGETFPGTVCVSGGSDSGMDGAVPEGGKSPFPLICTTGVNVIGNLRRNLQSYIDDGGERRIAIITTSQFLTARRRQNLKKAANEKGFELIQIFDGKNISRLLYHNPYWCKELLGISGNPPPLSSVPLSNRISLEGKLEGRELDLEWLEKNNGDLILTGHSGAGKTYLLQQIAKQINGLFVVSKDFGEIANALRRQQPQTLFVDDAYADAEFLSRLLHLRQGAKSDFRIIATCWPSQVNEVMTHLKVGTESVRKLELLTREQILSIIKEAGIHGSDDLLHELLNQSEGKPGLAVTLCHICINGNYEDITLAETLVRDTQVVMQRHAGKKATSVLSGFCVGGDKGMKMEVVGSILGISLADMHSIVTQLATGGILRDEQNGSLSVRPPALRHGLVRHAFFAGSTSLPIEPFLEKVESIDSALVTLINAKGRGASIPDSLIIPRLESASSDTPWKLFTSLGSREAEWVLTHHPEKTLTVARQSLMHIPGVIISLLLQQSINDERDLSNATSHPLRIIQDWIEEAVPGRPEALERRQSLIETVLEWVKNNGDISVAIHAICIGLSCAHRRDSSAPGSGMTWTMHFSCLTAKEIRALLPYWKDAVILLKSHNLESWKHVEGIAEDYIYRRHIRDASESISKAMRKMGVEMLQDMVSVASSNFGVLHWAKRIARNAKVKMEIPDAGEFDVIFPPDDRLETKKREQERTKDALDLAKKWLSEEPREIARRFSDYLKEANQSHCWPRYDHVIFLELSKKVKDPNVWLDAMVEYKLSAGGVDFFLRRIILEKKDGWENIVLKLLEMPEQRASAMYELLTMDSPPPKLWNEAKKYLKDHKQTIEMCSIRGEIPIQQMHELLLDTDPSISTAAAVGEWHAKPDKKKVRPELEIDWMQAVAFADNTHHWLHEVFEKFPDIAYKWVENKLRTRADRKLRIYLSTRDLSVGIQPLSKVQRRKLLDSIPDDCWCDESVRQVISGDIDLFKDLLNNKKMKYHHLAPMRGQPKGKWIENAKLALAKGYSHEEITGATRSGTWSWSGDESDMLKSWVEDFKEICGHKDPDIKKIGELGYKWMKNKYDKALKEEHAEKVYGI